MCTPCTPPHATHTPNWPNAWSVQLTFACVVMTGESRYRGAAVLVSADFSGAATPAHRTPGTSCIHPRVCAVRPGKARRACTPAAATGATPGAAVRIGRRRVRPRGRERDRARQRTHGRRADCLHGLHGGLLEHSFAVLRVYVLLLPARVLSGLSACESDVVRCL